MSDARDLNFQVTDYLINDLGMEAQYLLDSLIKSMDAYQVNDHLAFIVRMEDIDTPFNEELEKYEKDD